MGTKIKGVISLGGVHKLRLSTRFGFFWPPTPLRLHFVWYKSLQKVNLFDHLPPSSCKSSLWTTPYLNHTVFIRLNLKKMGPIQKVKFHAN